MYYISPGTVTLRVARRLRIGWPHQYSAVLGAGSYALTGNDATLTYTPASDTTPDAWSFVDQTSVALSTVIIGAAVTVSGLGPGVSITYNASGGTIDKNGDGNFLGSQILQNGDTFRPRVTSSSGFSTAVSCVVAASPSGVSDTFTATTLASSSFDYYIGPSGSDSNPGTQAQPWAISALNTKRATYAGKRVGLLDGTYNVLAAIGTYPTQTTDVGLGIAGGTSGAHTVIQAVNARAAILDGKMSTLNQATYACGVIGPIGNYVELRDVKIIDAGNSAVMCYSVNDWIVAGCWVTGQFFTAGGGNNSACFRSTITQRGLISNCLIENSGAPGDGNRWSGYLCFGSTDGVIENLTIRVADETDDDINSIHVKNAGGLNANVRNTVRNCYVEARILFEDTGSTGGNNYIHHNVIKSQKGLKVDASARPTLIYNNTLTTLAGFESGGSSGGIKAYPSTGAVHAYNNIFDRAQTGAYGDANYPTSAGARGTIDYNAYLDGTPAPQFQLGAHTNTYNGLAAWTAATGHDSHSATYTAPSYVATGSDAAYYQLSSGSALKNVSTSDGTTGGTPCDPGAWGNSPPSYIGCNF